MTTVRFAPVADSTGGYAGFSTSWRVPAQVTVLHIDMVGGGTRNQTDTKHAGGGVVTGDLAVTPGQRLWLYLGGPGNPPGLPPQGSFFGLFGGGSGKIGPSGTGGSGHGYTAIFPDVGGSPDLSDPICVAGGAGGFVYSTIVSPPDFSGGAGGGDVGQDGSHGPAGTSTGYGTGGTQSAGGNGGPSGTDGSFMQGGNGGGTNARGAGGGGGGYFGGGGGGSGTSSAGGGGSNYDGGLTGATSIQSAANPLLGNTKFPGINLNAPSITITFDAPPNPPIIISPANGTGFDVAQDLFVLYLFDDPDDDPPASAGNIQFRVPGSGWGILLNSAVMDGNVCKSGIPGGIFTPYIGLPLEIQAATVDSHGETSDWGPSVFVTASAAPDPFVFDPLPTIITSPTPVIQGARGSGNSISGYRIQLVNDVSGEPGSTIIAETSGEFGTDQPNITVAMPNLLSSGIIDGHPYHFLVWISNPTGVWQTNPTDSGPILSEIAAPFPPSAVVLAVNSAGAVQVTITNPNVDTDPYPPDYNNVYRTDMGIGTETRVGTGIPINGVWVDPNPGFHRSYRYRIAAVHFTGVEHESSSE